MAYKSLGIKKELTIDRIVTIHYFEYMSDFAYPGESHDFWELLCVDKGEVIVQAGTQTHILRKDDMIFHQPKEFHTVKANGVVAPNLVVLSFCSRSAAMSFFNGRILKVQAEERRLLADIITEARNAYQNRLDDPYTEYMVRKPQPDGFGSEQMIQMYLQQLLIRLIRRLYSGEQTMPPAAAKHVGEDELFYRIQEYMNANLAQQLTIDQICRQHLVSRSTLQKLIRERAGCGIIEYFNRLKISVAKQLIRGRRMNFTQIADELGYTSIHYFSRQFRQITGMSPSEYAASIKALTDRKL